jgi:hypothetical protein
MALFEAGRAREALVQLDAAEVIFREECAGVSWERATVIVIALWCLWLVGDLAELARRAPLYLREADERGDRYFAAGLRSGLANVYWLLEDDPARARKENQAVLASLSMEAFHLQHFYHLLAEVNLDLYERDGPSADRKAREQWPRLWASRMLRVNLVRLPALHLRARAALGAAELEQDSRRSAFLLRVAARMATRLYQEPSHGAQGLALLIRAALANRRADQDTSAELLECAVRALDAAQLVVFAQAARRRAAELSGDADAVLTLDRHMVEMGVKAPLRLTGMLAPGFSPVRR